MGKYEPGGYPPPPSKNAHARWLREAARITHKAGLTSIAHTCEQAADEIDALLRRADLSMDAVQAKQAKIDALMFEFCPGEMTPAQRKEYARSQVVAEMTASMAVRSMSETCKWSFGDGFWWPDCQKDAFIKCHKVGPSSGWKFCPWCGRSFEQVTAPSGSIPKDIDDFPGPEDFGMPSSPVSGGAVDG